MKSNPYTTSIIAIKKIVEVQTPITGGEEEEWANAMVLLNAVYPSSTKQYVSDTVDGGFRRFQVEVQP